MTKKLLFAALFTIPSLLFCFSVSAQSQPATEDVGYELPALVSEKTVPMFDAVFANMPGVRITDYCYNMSLVIFSVDRSLQHDNAAIEQKIHGIFKTDDSMLHLQSKPSFSREGFLAMCNEQDHIKR